MLVGDGGGGFFAQQTAVTSPSSYEGLDGAGHGVIEPEVAAGPGHVMEVMQGGCQVFFKQLGQTQNCKLGQIFTTYNNCGDIGDNRVLYDALSQKWFVAGISNVYSSCPYSQQTFLQHFDDIAVSPTNDPSTSLPGTLFPQNWYEYHAVMGLSGSTNYLDPHLC